MNNEENRNDATPKMVELIEQDIRKDASECSEGADYQETQEGNGFFREEENDRIRNRTHRKNRKWKSQVAALLLCGVLIGAGVPRLIAAMQDTGSTETTLQVGSRSVQAVTLSSVDTSTKLTAAELYANCVNSTVGITTSTTTNLWGYETESAASGSGFIISADGYILTNYHVIENSDTITVTTYDGTAYEAEVTGYDEDNDIAVLKVDASDLTPVTLGDSDSLNVGDEVAAIGNPLGELTFSLTTGIVSAKDRQVTMSNGVTMNLLQTDCAINSGNSGGALFNMYGEVIGITNAKYSGSSSGSSASVDNIAFAIPISSVVNMVQSIIENGTVSKPYIGVSVKDTSSEMSSYGLPSGAVVASVTEGGPAETAGLQENDIITKAGDTEITSASDLTAAVRKLSKGDTLTLTVYRQGETLEISVIVDEETQSALESTSSESEDTNPDSGYGYSDGGQSMPWGNSGGFGGGQF